MAPDTSLRNDERKPWEVTWEQISHTKDRFHALRRMGATHDGAPRTPQWLNIFFSPWTHTGAYSTSVCKTHFPEAATIGR